MNTFIYQIIHNVKCIHSKSNPVNVLSHFCSITYLHEERVRRTGRPKNTTLLAPKADYI